MPIKVRAALLVTCLGLTALPVASRAEAPLSAIDWLSQSVSTPPGTIVPGANRPPEAPVAPGGALPADVAVRPIDGPSPDAAGLFSPARSGLPRDLWGMGLEEEIIARLSESQTEALPALQALVMTLMLAEATPPVDSAGDGRFVLARVDRLLALGALDQAEALLEASGKTTPEAFRRAFDIALLTGHEDKGCARMRELPNLAPTFQARVFCLARSGDWNAAALTLRTAQALGQIDDTEDALLSRFLDPDLYEEELVPPPPPRMTPLTWRLYEAIGEPLPTATLPVAFAHAELRETAGWKGQIEAAERLARAGAVAPNLLLGLYTQRQPAASGGVWDRAAAVQRIDSALARGDMATVAQSLPVAWARMAEAELEVPFAQLFAERLKALPLTGEAGRAAFEIALLSSRAQDLAASHAPASAREAFLIALANGQTAGAEPQDSLGRAILAGYQATALPAAYAPLVEQRRMGEAILLAVAQIGRGLRGEAREVSEGLAALRLLGLEDAARRTALQLVLLERRG
jgi:hypothetical protein